MQKLFSVGNPEKYHISDLKKLWVDVFGDSENVINNFFNNTALLENIVCVFFGNKPVSVLYAVPSTVYVNSTEYKAYYVYGVCTHPDFRGNKLSEKTFAFLEEAAKKRGISYLLLVPAQESLFKMYEGMGFKICFSYNQEKVFKDSLQRCESALSELSFSDYKKYRAITENVPYAVLDEEGFRSFYRLVEDNINCISVRDQGFAVYETENGNVTVFELFGNESLLVSAIFKLTEASSIDIRRPDAENGVPYGMLKSLDGADLFENGFFGVPYGG